MAVKAAIYLVGMDLFVLEMGFVQGMMGQKHPRTGYVPLDSTQSRGDITDEIDRLCKKGLLSDHSCGVASNNLTSLLLLVCI